MFDFFNFNLRKKKRKFFQKFSDFLSPLDVINPTDTSRKLRKWLQEEFEKGSKPEDYKHIIDGLTQGIEEFIENHVDLYIYKQQTEAKRKRFRRFWSFIILFFSVVSIIIISSISIENPKEQILFTLVVGALLGIFPISYIAYSYYKSEVQKDRLENDLRLLGLVSEENINEISELYNTVYNPFQFGVYIILFVTLASIIFAAYYKKDELTVIKSITVEIIFYAFLGSYFFGIQLLIRRYNTFDLQPQVYSAVILRTLLSAVITFSIASLIGGIEKNNTNLSLPNTVVIVQQENPNQPSETDSLPWQILAFLIGIFPTRGIRWITFVANRALSAPIEQYNEYPLKNILGINTWHEARLSELGIDNVQSLATTDICKLLLSTQFDTQQIVNWVDQAILCMKLGSKVERLRELNINTFHELQIAILEVKSDEDSYFSSSKSNSYEVNQKNNGYDQQDTFKRLSSALALTSDDIKLLSDYSNYPNYTHIKSYYRGAPEIASKQAATGKQFLMKSLSRQITISGILLASYKDEETGGNVSISIHEQKAIEQEIKELKMFLKENPNNAKEYINLGTRYYLLNQVSEAKRVYQQAILLDSNLAEAYNNRSVIFIDEGNYEEAIRDTRQAIRINSHFDVAYSNLGLAQLRQNDAFSAIDTLTKAINCNCRLAAAYYYRGVAYNTVSMGEEHFRLAVADFERAYLLGYEGDVLWSAWGLALSSLGEYEEAMEKYDEAIARCGIISARLYARRAYAYLQFGTSLYNDEKNPQPQKGAVYYQKAYFDFEKATAKEDNAPASAFANFGLLKALEGDMKAKEGKKEEAKKYYDEAIHKYTKAIEIYHNTLPKPNNKDAARENGELYEFHRNLAMFYQKVGDYENAKLNYSEAIRLGDETVETHFNYGICLFKFGNSLLDGAIHDYNEDYS
ncbi:tetratricopeptide repeat protein [Chlorogloeopsis sp. ULAP01]|uniref:tetratricopeptide repeat protein n=1 Tax=Chlorogloeopsis sp. ULAP01 TaxID=3056483 RepID=UPI0025AA7FAE|nr:tetratricopeptide repeat protein [Chlorogloeopsis sp. ULAP01]MDM9385008.1 tetratricopeptide repeat protein [Chlorogloeopsis sp. ULAP01]